MRSLLRWPSDERLPPLARGAVGPKGVQLLTLRPPSYETARSVSRTRAEPVGAHFVGGPAQRSPRFLRAASNPGSMASAASKSRLALSRFASLANASPRLLRAQTSN